MKFQWKLFPLQRRLEWDFDAAQGRLALLLRGGDSAAALLRALESQQAEQALHAGTHGRVQTDPARHAQALAYLCAMDARIVQARREERRLQQEIAAARAECLRCRQRLDAVDRLREQAAAAHLQEQLRCEAKETDLAWLARCGSQPSYPGEHG